MLDERKCAIWKTGPLVRVELFSDAVFAIAITLLVVDLKVPEATSSAKLPDALRGLWPHFCTYFLTFAIVAMQWVDHHEIFDHVERCSRGLFWMNFLFLSCIAFLPFPTAVLGRFPNEPASAVFYSAVVALTLLAKCCLWTYIARWSHPLKPDLSPKFVRSITVLWVGGLCLAIILFALACFWPRLALSSWTVFGLVSIAFWVREPRESVVSGVAEGRSSTCAAPPDLVRRHRDDDR
jgi:uncharacterized membrane protein